MYHIVGVEPVNNVAVHDIMLDNDLIHVIETFIQFYSLLQRDRRKLIIAEQCRVTQCADNYAAVFVRLIYNIQMAFVDDIGTKANINSFHGSNPAGRTILHGRTVCHILSAACRK